MTEVLNDNKEVLVSVCVITYNHKNYISECLDGVLMQRTNFPFEIILGEDESSDGTRELCIEYAKNNPDKIKLFLRSRKDVIYVNGKPTGRFNYLESVKAAKGKYIAICEGDDYWTDPNKLQKQIDFLEANPEYAICFHAVNILENKTLRPSELNLSKKEESYSILDLANSNLMHTPSVVFRKGLFEKFPDWFNESPVGDYVIHLLNAKKGLIKYLPQAMAVYRVQNAGVWGHHGMEVNHPKWLWLLDKLLGEDFDDTVLQRLAIQRKRTFIEYIELLLQRKQYDLIKKACHDFGKENEYGDLLRDLFITKIDEMDRTVQGITNRRLYKTGQKLSDLKYRYSNLLNRKGKSRSG